MQMRTWLALGIAGWILPGIVAQTKPKNLLTLERLYRLPSVIGTRPEMPRWSPDSRRLVFLWNDAGLPFLDVWMADAVEATHPVRLTHMTHPAAPVDVGVDLAKLEAQAHFETDHGVSGVEWSADGKRVFFTLQGKLYGLVPGQEPQVLVASDVVTVLPAPAGVETAFVTGSGALGLLHGAGSTVEWLYTPVTGVAVEAAYWSPDGTRLAVVEADSRAVPVRGIPDYLTDETTLRQTKRPFPGENAETRRVGVVAAAGGPIRWMTLPGKPMDLVFGVAWSPDGRTLLVDRSDLYIKHRRLLQVDAETGASTVLVAEDDAKNVTAEWWSGWAPDGRGVYYTSDQPPATDYAVWFKPLGEGAAWPVLSGPYAVFSAEIARDGSALFATTNAGHAEERQVMRLDLQRGGEAQLVHATAGTHETVASPDGRLLADVFSSDTKPPDLYLQRLGNDGTDGAERVTTSPLPEFQAYDWIAPSYVTFPNVHDGTMLHARMTLPRGFERGKPRAAILGSVYSNTARNQWGGRVYHPTWGLDQVLAQQGYVLLNTDIRGSSGYGRAFRQRLAMDYGGVDVDDLYSAAQYLVHSGTADPKRLGIWGSSYGGLLTTMSLFTHPETFQAGVAGAPATSLFHALTGEMRTMMDPQTHVEEYRRSSAFLKSGGLEGHLMLLQGMRDDVVLFKDSVTLTERLILQGKDVTLTPLPDARHGWDTEGLAQTRYAYRKLVDYFNRWVPVR